MKKRGKIKGFTLPEMMVVIAILGVLSAIAYPSFQYTLSLNRAKYGESEINKALAYARSEAISRNKYIGICPVNSDNSQICATSDNDCPSAKSSSRGCSWTNGFLVYVDHDLDYSLDPSKDEIIQHFYVNEKPLIIQLDTLNLTWKAGGIVLYSEAGLTNKTINIIPSNDPNSTSNIRKCTIATTGRTLCAVNK